MLLFFDFSFLMLAPLVSVEVVVGEESVAVNHKLYPSPENDGVLVMGEVINNLGTAISKVNVSITFYGEGAQELEKAYCMAFLDVIPPSRRSAFKYPFGNEDIENYAYYDVVVSSYVVLENPKPTGFSILSSKAVLYADRTEVTGTVKNIVSGNVSHIGVFALLYDENGFVAATDMDQAISTLEPNGTGPFSCFTRVINNASDVVQCIITGESWTYGVETEKVIFSAKSQDDWVNYAIAAAVIVGIAALALSLFLLRKRFRKRRHGTRSKLSGEHSASMLSRFLKGSWLIVAGQMVLSTRFSTVLLENCLGQD